MLATAGVALAMSLAAPIAVAPAPALTIDTGRVRALVIAVPDLRWSDLASMPRLRAFAGTAAVGDLSVKAGATRADCNDGLLTFNAGDRVDSRVGGCGLSLPAFENERRRAASSSFDAAVGALGEALRSGGFDTEALNVAAVPLLADGSGQVTARPDRTGAVNATLPAVDAVVDDGLYVGRPDQRVVTAGMLDSEIGRQLDDAPPNASVFIVGVSDAPSGHAHLHVLLVRHVGWGHVELARPSTRSPYVALIDLAPTLLHLLGQQPPESMAGRYLHPTATPARDWTAYDDQDRHAQAASSTSKPLRYALAIASLAVLLLLGIAGLGRGGDAAGRVAVWLARLVVGVPVFAFLVQRLPWWRYSGLAIAAMFAGAAVAFAVVTTVAARRSPLAAVVVVPAMTALALLADQLAGAPLQISSPLGDNPLIGGRFHGMGNIDFSVFATVALLCAGVAGGALASRGRRALGLAVAAVLGLLALVVDGAPSLGDDAGGAVTLLTAVVLMLAVLTGMRISWRRAVVTLLVAVGVVVAAGVADHARGAGAQTHLGRFIGQLLHGGAGTQIRRRLTAVGTSFGNVPLTLLVVATVVAVVAARAALLARASRVPGMLAALAGVAVVAILGTFLNDSGVVVGGFAVIVALGSIAGAGLLSAAPPDPMPDQAG